MNLEEDMNVICLGGRITGFEPARDLIRAFLNALFKGEERFRRRLRKVMELERQGRSNG